VYVYDSLLSIVAILDFTHSLIYIHTHTHTHSGDYFPLHGTCLGLELLSMLVNNGNFTDTLTHTDSEGISLPLDFQVADPQTQTRLFSLLTEEQVVGVGTENVTVNEHHWGVALETFRHTQALLDFFTLVRFFLCVPVVCVCVRERETNHDSFACIYSHNTHTHTLTHTGQCIYRPRRSPVRVLS
jgi:hypothetical protein